jgi:hypothetical protein
LERKGSEPLNVSFFQKRVCSCMVDEKMTQCADSIDTQFNVLFSTWCKSVEGWFEGDACPKRGCICKEPGFLKIKSRQDLWDFLFRGECAPQPDPTRKLPHDAAEHSQLRYPCVAAECDKKGCLKDKLALRMKYKKWTPVPRGKAKATGGDDGDEDYDDAAKGEKWSKEILPCESSRPDFMLLLLESVPVPVRAPPHTTPRRAPARRTTPRRPTPHRAALRKY